METIFHYLLIQQKGCIRFNYGQDLSHEMTEEELEYMDDDYIAELNAKVDTCNRIQNAIKSMSMKEPSVSSSIKDF